MLPLTPDYRNNNNNNNMRIQVPSKRSIHELLYSIEDRNNTVSSLNSSTIKLLNAQCSREIWGGRIQHEKKKVRAKLTLNIFYTYSKKAIGT